MIKTKQKKSNSLFIRTVCHVLYVILTSRVCTRNVIFSSELASSRAAIKIIIIIIYDKNVGGPAVTTHGTRRPARTDGVRVMQFRYVRVVGNACTHIGALFSFCSFLSTFPDVVAKTGRRDERAASSSHDHIRPPPTTFGLSGTSYARIKHV